LAQGPQTLADPPALPRLQGAVVKLAFHGADTDTGTGTDTDFLARILVRKSRVSYARMYIVSGESESVSVSVSVSVSWNSSFTPVCFRVRCR